MNKKEKQDLIGRVNLLKQAYCGSDFFPVENKEKFSKEFIKGAVEALDDTIELLEAHFKRVEKGEYKK